MRIYFCSDVHASRKCWKKFLASAKFYDADMIIVGGDITGKFIVPIVHSRAAMARREVPRAAAAAEDPPRRCKAQDADRRYRPVRYERPRTRRPEYEDDQAEDG